MTDRPPYRLHASLMYQLTLAARLQERRLDDGLKRLGLTRITWCVLLAVHNESLSQPSDIAEFIGIDRASTSRALRQMEDRGWVARAAGSGDRRTTRVALTRAGIDLIQRATPLAEENSHHFLSKLSADEVSALARILAKLHKGEDRGLVRF